MLHVNNYNKIQSGNTLKLKAIERAKLLKEIKQLRKKIRNQEVKQVFSGIYPTYNLLDLL